MIRYGAILGLAASFTTTGGAQAQVLLATPPIVVDEIEKAPSPGALGAVPALLQPAAPAAKALQPTGNPLWAVPLKSLSVTRERPIFTPSRRPPAPPVLAAAISRPAPPPPKPSEPDHPLLSLVGTVVGSTEGIGIFLDQTTKAVVRLRTGEDHSGWILRSVEGREARFDKGQQTATLALPAPGAGPGTQGPITTGTVASGTWMDGDGQMITPPPGASARPSLPAVATPTAGTPSSTRRGEKEL
jgi:general secretion pathway protein N